MRALDLILTHYFWMSRQFYTKLHGKSKNTLQDDKWMPLAELKIQGCKFMWQKRIIPLPEILYNCILHSVLHFLRYCKKFSPFRWLNDTPSRHISQPDVSKYERAKWLTGRARFSLVKKSAGRSLTLSAVYSLVLSETGMIYHSTQ